MSETLKSVKSIRKSEPRYSANQSRPSHKSLNHSDMRKRLEHEQMMMDSKDQMLMDMRHSAMFMQDMSMFRKYVNLNNVEVDVNQKDIHQLNDEKNQNIAEIEDLQNKIEEMAANLTIGDVSQMDSNINLRPSVLSAGSQ